MLCLASRTGGKEPGLQEPGLHACLSALTLCVPRPTPLQASSAEVRQLEKQVEQLDKTEALRAALLQQLDGQRAKVRVCVAHTRKRGQARPPSAR